jgi:putative MATE family efflux protein
MLARGAPRRCAPAAARVRRSPPRAAAARRSRVLAAAGSDKALAPSVDQELAAIAVPTLFTLAAEPVAALVSTAWVGQMGAQQLAAVAAGSALHTAVTRLLNPALLALATGATAAALGGSAEGAERERAVAAAASSALALGLLIGLAQAAALLALGGRGLAVWGAGPGSSLHADAAAYLRIRALTAPAAALFLAGAGAARGLGDTRSPLLATLACQAVNLVLEPLFIFKFGWGVAGAAAALGAAQVVACAGLVAALARSPALGSSRRSRLGRGAAGAGALGSALRFARPAALLTARTLCVTAVYGGATALAMRNGGAAAAAAHAIAFQLWLAASLLADSLAVAAQSLITRGLAAATPAARARARAVALRVSTLALALGAGLAAALAAAFSLFPVAHLFTRDAAVAALLAPLLTIVAATQPVNSLAFALDGVVYGCGARGFAAAASVMAAGAAPALSLMALGGVAAGAGPAGALAFVWAGLAALMLMRAAGLLLPLLARRPPFDYLGDA